MIKELLETVNIEERVKLEYNYRKGVPYYFEYEDGKYVGVYANQIPTLSPEVVEAHWSIGSIIG